MSPRVPDGAAPARSPSRHRLAARAHLARPEIASLSALALLLLPAACGQSEPDCEGDSPADAAPCSEAQPAPPTGPDALLVEAEDPGLPSFPDTIETVSISVRTGDEEYDGTDDNTLSLCLSETTCFPLNMADVDDFRLGETDVYHFEGLWLPRSSVDRVELRSSSGADRWTPSCIDLRFDGEPVHCSQLQGLHFGEGPDELESWSDPEGLHSDCSTCFDSTLVHGPMLGAVEPGLARVWVRSDATRAVSLQITGGDDLSEAPVVAWAYPSPLQDFTAVLEAGVLVPDTDYLWGVSIDGELKASGSLRSAPPRGEPGRTTLAFGSCAKHDVQPIFDSLAELDTDLFFFVGDNHYANSDDLPSLRHAYRWSRERPSRGAFLATTPILATWDDHDFTGNNTDGTEPGKQTALQAFTENWANPSYGLPDLPGVFFRTSYRDIDFFFLDDRYYRGFEDSMLGAWQQDWLTAQLLESSATFKVIVNGSQWTLQGSSDSWASFADARDSLFDRIRDERIDGVVLLSGDVHRSEFRSIPRASAGAYDLPELTSSPLANSNSDCRGESEELACYDSGSYFVSVELDTSPDDPLLTARIHDVYGEVLDEWMISHSELTVP